MNYIEGEIIVDGILMNVIEGEITYSGLVCRFSSAMSIFSSLMVLLLILVEAAPPTASSVPTLGEYFI